MRHFATTFADLLAVGAGIAGALSPLVILWLRRRALREPAPAGRMLTAEELERLRRLRRHENLRFFVGLPVLIAGIVAVSLLQAWPVAQAVLLVLVIGAVAAFMALRFAIRCTVCGYRVTMSSGSGVPHRCERCRSRLSTRRRLVDRLEDRLLGR